MLSLACPGDRRGVGGEVLIGLSERCRLVREGEGYKVVGVAVSSRP